MNIIFLDIDGVLNSHRKLEEVYNKTHKPHSGYEYPFDEICLNNLKKLVEITDSKLVITSVWRKDEEGRVTLTKALKEYELDQYIIGYTPILGKKRGIEIQAYLDQLDYTPNFIILDDNSDMEELINYLVKTNIKVGLTESNVEEAIIKLTKKRT